MHVQTLVKWMDAAIPGTLEHNKGTCLLGIYIGPACQHPAHMMASKVHHILKGNYYKPSFHNIGRHKEHRMTWTVYSQLDINVFVGLKEILCSKRNFSCKFAG
jgi:hypothetical protein